jgi:hypothetical protein
MFKSTVKKSAGLNATWNERFRLKPLRDPNEIFLQVFAGNVLTDQFIGESGVVKFKDLKMNGEEVRDLSLKDKDNKNQGKVKVRLIMRDHDTESEEDESSEVSETENTFESPPP